MAEKAICPQCNAPLSPEMKFCVMCGARVLPAEPEPQDVQIRSFQQFTPHKVNTVTGDTPDNVDITKHHAQWVIQPGVIAMRISPSDFENLNNVTGINIQKGVTACIYADGDLIARLNGGHYDFISQRDIDQLLDSKATHGLLGKIKIGWNALVRSITGKKVRDVVEKGKDYHRDIKNIDDVIKALQPTTSIDVYLKIDAPFDVIFGGERDREGNISFKPLKIPCQRLSADVGLSLIIEITDFEKFMSKFMLSKSIVTVYDIEQYLESNVKAILTNRLRNVEIDEYGIAPSVIAEISQMLQEYIEIPGARVRAIRDVTTSNADLARLKLVADEMFLSEKELEYAIRSNEFSNRLAGVENTRKINEARTDFELYKALSEINKDKALHDDELDEFYTLMSRQKIIRDATNIQEVESALDDIAKLRLLKEDEMEALRVELLTKNTDRAAVAEIMQMNSMASVEKKRLEIEAVLTNQQYILEQGKRQNAHALRRDHLLDSLEIDEIEQTHKSKKVINNLSLENDVLDIKIGQRKKVDSYEDDRYEKNLQRERDNDAYRLEMENRRRQMEFEEMERKRRLEAEEIERLNRQNKDIFAMWADEEERKARYEHAHKMEDKHLDYQHELDMTSKLSTHEEALKNLDVEKMRVKATMTADQLMAEQAAQLDSEAQRRMADAMGGAKVSEAEKRIREEQLAEARRQEERQRREAYERERLLREDQRAFFNQLSEDRNAILDRMSGMMGMFANVRGREETAHEKAREADLRYEEAKRMAAFNEREVNRISTRLAHEQERNDAIYKNVLSHEEQLHNASVNAIKASRPNQKEEVVDTPPTIICPSCHRKVPVWKFCQECGSEIKFK